jgi:hypothetical protein
MAHWLHLARGVDHGTPREYYPKKPIVYTCELSACPECHGRLSVAYTSGAKTVQTMAGVLTIAHQ